MGLETVFSSIASSATGSLSYFFPTLAAALLYFQYDLMDPESRPIDVPSEVLLPAYDFIVVGAGSAGLSLLEKFPSSSPSDTSYFLSTLAQFTLAMFLNTLI